MIIFLANDPYSLSNKLFMCLSTVDVMKSLERICTHATFFIFCGSQSNCSIYNSFSSRRKTKAFIQIYQFGNVITLIFCNFQTLKQQPNHLQNNFRIFYKVINREHFIGGTFLRPVLNCKKFYLVPTALMNLNRIMFLNLEKNWKQ